MSRNNKFVLIDCKTNTLAQYIGGKQVQVDSFSGGLEPYLVETYRLSPKLMLDYLETL